MMVTHCLLWPVLKQELVIARSAALMVALPGTLAVYWYLGRTGRKP